MQEHGGKLTVSSEPGLGTVFTILLPVVAKVQIIFSLVGRDLYDYAAGGTLPVPVPPEINAFPNPQGKLLPADWQ